MKSIFSAIDWLLKEIASFFSGGLTAILRGLVGLFGGSSASFENEHYLGAVNFFFYDMMKIFLMLSIIIFIVSIIRSFFPPERMKKLLGEGKARGFLGNIFAALLGGDCGSADWCAALLQRGGHHPNRQ